MSPSCRAAAAMSSSPSLIELSPVSEEETALLRLHCLDRAVLSEKLDLSTKVLAKLAAGDILTHLGDIQRDCSSGLYRVRCQDGSANVGWVTLVTAKGKVLVRLCADEHTEIEAQTIATLTSIIDQEVDLRQPPATPLPTPALGADPEKDLWAHADRFFAGRGERAEFPWTSDMEKATGLVSHELTNVRTLADLHAYLLRLSAQKLKEIATRGFALKAKRDKPAMAWQIVRAYRVAVLDPTIGAARSGPEDIEATDHGGTASGAEDNSVSGDYEDHLEHEDQVSIGECVHQLAAVDHGQQRFDGDGGDQIVAANVAEQPVDELALWSHARTYLQAQRGLPYDDDVLNALAVEASTMDTLDSLNALGKHLSMKSVANLRKLVASTCGESREAFALAGNVMGKIALAKKLVHWYRMRVIDPLAPPGLSAPDQGEDELIQRFQVAFPIIEQKPFIRCVRYMSNMVIRECEDARPSLCESMKKIKWTPESLQALQGCTEQIVAVVVDDAVAIDYFLSSGRRSSGVVVKNAFALLAISRCDSQSFRNYVRSEQDNESRRTDFYFESGKFAFAPAPSDKTLRKFLELLTGQKRMQRGGYDKLRHFYCVYLHAMSRRILHNAARHKQRAVSIDNFPNEQRPFGHAQSALTV